MKMYLLLGVVAGFLIGFGLCAIVTKELQAWGIPWGIPLVIVGAMLIVSIVQWSKFYEKWLFRRLVP